MFVNISGGDKMNPNKGVAILLKKTSPLFSAGVPDVRKIGPGKNSTIES